jgi:UDP-N-acetylglucosamine acyltransferase
MPVDPSAYVAPTARIHPDAIVGPGCRIGEYVVIEEDVVLGRGCMLEPYVYVKRWTTMGDGNRISAGTVLGTDPLDKNFSGERSYLRIGDGNIIREHFTISRGTAPESETVLGDDNYIMTAGHVAHNCRVGSHTVIASTALLAGYVELGDYAFISGGVVVHQYSRVGRNAMVAGNVRVNQDLPPFLLYAHFESEPIGLNLVGLRRAGFSAQRREAIKEAYRLLYKAGLKLDEALRRIEAEAATPDTLEMVEFVRGTKRGIAR